MAGPNTTFPNFNSLETYFNNEWIPNGVQHIDGQIGNNGVNGLLTFIRQSPLNYAKAAIFSSGGAINTSIPVVLFMTTTPSSLIWGDNIYNEYVFMNMTSAAIPVIGGFVYYDMDGAPHTSIPANTAVNIMKAANDLWVQVGAFGAGGGGGSGYTPAAPATYVVGTTAGAPTAGSSTWTNAAFANRYVQLVIARSIFVDQSNAGDGGPWTQKTLSASTLVINNYTFQTGDILSYILL